jgi:Fe-S oxidoreductase
MDDASLFRFKPGYKTIALKPVFDWSAWDVQNDPVTEQTTAPGTGGDSTGGLAKAVEMCNNNGHCRKFDAGTMCPSYRVTRDEQHATRGRANTLRLALSGQLEGTPAEEAFTSPAVAEALDLCVGCKGCKRDCPTGVDMAKMKLEWKAQHVQRHGSNALDRWLARLPALAHSAGRVPGLAPLLNLRNKLPGARAFTEKWLGLSAQRRLPAFRADTFWAQQDRLGLATAEAVLATARGGGQAVVLFADTFNGGFETENLLDTVRVLQAAGYQVHAAQKPAGDSGHLCCGRPLLAAGLADQAKAQGRALVQALLPFADAGIAIVGLEPSCLLTMRDELLVMGLGPGLDEGAQRLARQALLLEEFIAREAAAGRFKARFKPATQAMAVHGHCHQKAFGAMPPVLAALKLIPGAQPSVIDSSCCGMAGSFGYEARHQAVSMQMAEASLLPAVRQAPDALIVADGTSCRHQIADGTRRQALHVARVLAAHLL